jgi:hypothetical protein
MKLFLQRMYRKYGTDFHGLQIDIHGYYPNMRHDVTNEMLGKKLDAEIRQRAVDVLDGQYAGDIGYNPGSQMVQIVGISALDDIDHTIKEKLVAKEYGRYMDDSLIFSESKEYLEQCRNEIKILLAQKGMEFNPKKTRVFHIKDGFTFLGFRYRMTDTGKVIMLINPANAKEERRKLRKLVNKAKRGEITKAKVDECYNAWKNHASKGNSFKLLQRMDKYYKELWRD